MQENNLKIDAPLVSGASICGPESFYHDSYTILEIGTLAFLKTLC